MKIALKQWFLPNPAPLSQRSMTILVAAEVAFFLVLWLTAQLTFFPSLKEVVSAFGELLERAFLVDLWVSYKLNLEAIVIMTVISLGLVYSSVIVPALRPIVAFFGKLRFNSLVGLSFYFVLFISGGHAIKLSLLVFGMGVWFVTQMSTVVSAIPREEYDHARTLGMSNLRIIWEVAILGRLDEAWEVMRQVAAMGWMMLTMVEGISRTEGGVGTLLLNSNKGFHLDQIVAIQIIMVSVGIVQDYVLGALGRLFFPYAHLGKE